MTHLSYVMAAYALGVLVPLAFAADAWTRMRRAERRLAAVETPPRAGARS